MPDILVTPNAPVGPLERKHLGIFSTYAESPLGVRFEHQENDEDILLFVRRHFITNVPWIIITILLLIAPLIILPFLSFFFPVSFELSFAEKTVLLLFYFLGVFGYTLIQFLFWFYNIGIVTQKNVVDIDYTDIVNVHVSATKVKQIEDVSYKQGGFFRSLFNFGDVFIQTAGHMENFEFDSIPQPGRAVDVVQDLIGT